MYIVLSSVLLLLDDRNDFAELFGSVHHHGLAVYELFVELLTIFKSVIQQKLGKEFIVSCPAANGILLYIVQPFPNFGVTVLTQAARSLEIKIAALQAVNTLANLFSGDYLAFSFLEQE